MTGSDLFGWAGHVSWGQECARAVVVFCFGLLLVRVDGRRVFGKWSALDIIVAIIVGSSLSRARRGNASLVGTILATTLLMVLHWLVAQAAARFPRISRLVEGSAIELAVGGEKRPATLIRQSISEADLLEALRQSGVERLGDTRLIMLEPSGKITVLKTG